MYPPYPRPGPYGQGPYGPPGPDPTLADPGSRLLARIIDGIICGAVIVVFVVGSVVIQHVVAPASLEGPDSAGTIAGGVVRLVVMFGGPFVYEWVMLARSGATVGKRIMKVRVVRVDRGPISGGRAAGRTAALLVFGFLPCVGLLNELWLLWDRPLQQCLHDKVVTTVVVRNP
jgi:uncharacterized RDD family membrane protein YckC